VVVIVTVNLRLRAIVTAIEAIRTALRGVRPGEVLQIRVPELE
jgi:hypothetical protein